MKITLQKFTDINHSKQHIIKILNSCLNTIYGFGKFHENRIAFSSFPDYSDNARVLYEYMIEKNLDKKYELIWIVSDKRKYNQMKDKGIKTIYCPHSLSLGRLTKYYSYGNTTKWVFFTHTAPLSPCKNREKQKIINLWHGGMGFKGRKGESANTYVKPDCDYILISGDGSITKSTTIRFHDVAEDILLPLGLPRTDLLFREKTIREIDSIFGKKIIWMPTFRESHDYLSSDKTYTSETGLPILSTMEDLLALNTFLAPRSIHMFIKIHPSQIENKILTESSYSNIHIITNEYLERHGIQLYEILNHFSALISDYSSVSFDYLYLNRPMAYTLDDFEEYKLTRGFAMDKPLDYMPGHHIYTIQDLMDFISDIEKGEDSYQEERARVSKLVGLAHGGDCCQRILDYCGIF